MSQIPLPLFWFFLIPDPLYTVGMRDLVSVDEAGKVPGEGQ